MIWWWDCMRWIDVEWYYIREKNSASWGLKREKFSGDSLWCKFLHKFWSIKIFCHLKFDPSNTLNPWFHRVWFILQPNKSIEWNLHVFYELKSSDWSILYKWSKSVMNNSTWLSSQDMQTWWVNFRLISDRVDRLMSKKYMLEWINVHLQIFVNESFFSEYLIFKIPLEGLIEGSSRHIQKFSDWIPSELLSSSIYLWIFFTFPNFLSHCLNEKFLE